MSTEYNALYMGLNEVHIQEQKPLPEPRRMTISFAGSGKKASRCKEDLELDVATVQPLQPSVSGNDNLSQLAGEQIPDRSKFRRMVNKIRAMKSEGAAEQPPQRSHFREMVDKIRAVNALKSKKVSHAPSASLSLHVVAAFSIPHPPLSILLVPGKAVGKGQVGPYLQP
jgi:hypothetical protein